MKNRSFFGKIIGLICCILLLRTPKARAEELVFFTHEHGDSLTRTLKALPEEAGDVLIRIDAPLAQDEDAYLMTLRYRSLKSLRIEADLPVHADDILEFYAWGIPLTVGAGIDLRECSIYGGGFASEGEELTFESTYVRLEGSAGFVFGGGFAENGGSIRVNQAVVETGPESVVYYEVFGGGYAHGTGSLSETERSMVNCSGESDYVLGGGFAEEGGRSLSGTAAVSLASESTVHIALFGGCSAAGEESYAEIRSTEVLLQGYARWTFGGDFAYNGGSTETKEVQMVTIGTDGRTDSVYMGSFASAEGSDALVNTSELHIEGAAADKAAYCLATDGASCKTRHTADFSH